MSTNAVIAVPDGDSWRGRYLHWDGYPSAVVPTLLALVERDGLARVTETLVTGPNYGWSSIEADSPAKFDVRSDLTEGWGVWRKETGRRFPVTDPGDGDGRFRIVGGYGVAYTDDVIPWMSGLGGKDAYQQVTEDEWISPEEGSAGLEFAYVLSPDGLVCLAPSEDETGTSWAIHSTYSWAASEVQA